MTSVWILARLCTLKPAPEQARSLDAEVLVREQERMAEFCTAYGVFKMHGESHGDGQ